MSAWRRITVLCSGARLFERGPAADLRDTLAARARTLLALVARQRRVMKVLRAAPRGRDFGDVEFAPDTDVQVFFMDGEPVSTNRR